MSHACGGLPTQASSPSRQAETNRFKEVRRPIAGESLIALHTAVDAAVVDNVLAVGSRCGSHTRYHGETVRGAHYEKHAVGDTAEGNEPLALLMRLPAA